MLPSGIWKREWLEIRATRRRVVLSALVPLALGLPVLALTLPALHQAACLSLLAALSAALGAGRRLWQLKEGGILSRLAVAPISPYRMLLEYVLLRTCVDYVLLLPLFTALLARQMPGLDPALHLLWALFPALCLAELAGLVSGSLAGSAGEVVLYTLVTLLPALLAAGVFTLEIPFPAAGPAAMSVLPFTRFDLAIRGVLARTPQVSWRQSAWDLLVVVGWLALALYFLRRRIAAASLPGAARRKRP